MGNPFRTKKKGVTLTTYGDYFKPHLHHVPVTRGELASIMNTERSWLQTWVLERGWWGKVKRTFLRLFTKRTITLPAPAVPESEKVEKAPKEEAQ